MKLPNPTHRQKGDPLMIPQAIASVNWLNRVMTTAREAVPWSGWPVMVPPSPALTSPAAQPELLVPLVRPHLSQLAQAGASLPKFVAESTLACHYLDLLGSLDWANFPERSAHRAWPGPTPALRAPFVAAFLVKLEEQKRYMSDLRKFLVNHPAIVWILGFPLTPSQHFSWGFDVEASLPTARHFGRVLRTLPNDALQFLLDSTVYLLGQELPPEVRFGQAISLDTKHILAWVAENNPKAYILESDRLTKTRQPTGDPDCKLGCKKKRNQSTDEAQVQTGPAQPATPTKNPRSVTNFSSSDVYYWGYASGVVATQVPDWGEFVLAELTQTFDRADPTYFFPLMAQVERRLGFKPKFGAFDAAFDPFYVFEYFHQAGGFAAVPLTERGGIKRTFDEMGLPLCQAGLAMPLKSAFICHTTAVEHQRGRYACPLLFPTPTGQTCPIAHKNWPQGGCLTTMATSIGARLRYQLDRDSDEFKIIYKQRTATERINSQATELGIERPKLRNRRAITNQDTLIYVLINLRGLKRVRARKAELAAQAEASLNRT
jgi:hypothetical protein